MIDDLNIARTLIPAPPPPTVFVDSLKRPGQPREFISSAPCVFCGCFHSYKCSGVQASQCRKGFINVKRSGGRIVE